MYKSFFFSLFLFLFIIACNEKEKDIKDSTKPNSSLTAIGTWIPQGTKWKKFETDTAILFSELKTYYFHLNGDLNISEGVHFLSHDTISFKNNIRFYKGNWKMADNKLSLAYKVNEGSGKMVFEEIGMGRVIELNGEKYIKVAWELKI